MSESIICTAEQFRSYLKENLSEGRYLHTLGVAETTERVLEHYGCTDYEKTWNGFSAGEFCGLAHDIAREKGGKYLVEYCDSRGLEVSPEERISPVLLHGLVSAETARELCGEYPASWYRAVAAHTTGDKGMDNLALALFIADFIEPGRRFMTEERRSRYLSEKSAVHCAYAILCDMIEHWKAKGYHDASEKSLALKADLEERMRSMQ